MYRHLGALSVVLLVAASACAQDLPGPRVSPHWLQSNLDMPNLRIVDLRGSIKDYWQGHIPGAVYLHPEALRMADRGTPGVLMPPRTLIRMLGDMGINNNTTVVAYAEGNDPTATYLLWALDYLGHEDYAILNGGFARWADDEHPVTQDYPEITPRQFWLQGMDRAERAGLRDVTAAIDDTDTVLLDVRNEALYTGEKGFWQRNGHIPGALHVLWVRNLTESGAWKSEDELRAMYAEMGVTPDSNVIVYCGQGLMSSQTWFTLKHLLGFPNVSNYDGSFSEWSSMEELPVATGSSPQ
jgi:thiosulfate/3-mercaptopyruvate sulfurtransferase